MLRVIEAVDTGKSEFEENSEVRRSADASCSGDSSGTSIIDLCGKATLTITQPVEHPPGLAILSTWPW